MNQPEDSSPCANLSSGANNDPAPVSLTGKIYEIRIRGQLSDIWGDWFEGLTIEYLGTGETLLSGKIVDQSALMGLLNKLVRLNLTLLSINEKTVPEENI